MCRPFDNQDFMRIRLETDAYYLILDKIQKKFYELIASPVHFREIQDISDVEEKYQLLYLLNNFSKNPVHDLKKTMNRTEELILLNFGVADAAHIAFAEQTADVFISCDDKLLKKCKKNGIKIKTMNPIEFCNEEELR